MSLQHPLAQLTRSCQMDAKVVPNGVLSQTYPIYILYILYNQAELSSGYPIIEAGIPWIYLDTPELVRDILGIYLNW